MLVLGVLFCSDQKIVQIPSTHQEQEHPESGDLIIIIIIIINTVAVLLDVCDWRMMLMLLGVSSYRRRVKERYQVGSITSILPGFLIWGVSMVI